MHPLNRQTPQYSPNWYPQSQNVPNSFYSYPEKKRKNTLLVQSYWIIWLVFAFVGAYVIGYLILIE